LEAILSIGYRPEIDGLRAFAILPVLFYHAGFSIFSGGYVGVDVFFVISGFLITSILIKEIENNTYSLINFYERRFRRILPAYIFMALLVVITGYILYLPSEFISLAESMLSSLGFVSNIYFWKHSGYFSLQAEFSPFLHTWSLSVEEQFYIFLPIFLFFVLTKFGRKITFWITLLAILLSLFLAEIGLGYSSSATFYLLPTRAWELLIGGILAFNYMPVIKNRSINEGLSFLGLGLILFTVFFYEKSTYFPGLSALPPVIGACLVIYSCSLNRTLIGKLLSSKALVYIGLISYPLYLFHWPVLVFFKNIYGAELSNITAWAAILISASLAFLSYRFVETPFTKRKISGNRKSLFTFSFSSIAVAASVCLVVIFSQGAAYRYSDEVLRVENALNDHSQIREKCHIEKRYSISITDKCVLGDVGVPPTYAFWGDSHAVELSDTLGKYAAKNQIAGIHISYSSCPPSQNFSWLGRPLCDEHNEDVLNMLVNNKNIKTIFLNARYNSYSRTDEMQKLMLDGFEKTVEELTKAGKHVVVISPVPRANGIVPQDLARLISRGKLPNNYSISFEEYVEQNSEIISRLTKIQQKYTSSTINLNELLCREEHCYFYIDKHPVLFDDDHLSLSGAQLFLPAMSNYLQRNQI
jgi:peptidoglycan/LPS O-acetylase OafA/YrhL